MGVCRVCEAEKCTLTLASDGSQHHGAGRPVESCNTCGPTRRRETSRRCGGEALRPGRIGESGRDVGRPRTEPQVLGQGRKDYRTSAGACSQQLENPTAASGQGSLLLGVADRPRLESVYTLHLLLFLVYPPEKMSPRGPFSATIQRVESLTLRSDFSNKKNEQ